MSPGIEQCPQRRCDDSQGSRVLIREYKATASPFLPKIQMVPAMLLPGVLDEPARWSAINSLQYYPGQAWCQSFFFMDEAVFGGRHHVLTFGFLTPSASISAESHEKRNTQTRFPRVFGCVKGYQFHQGLLSSLKSGKLEYPSLSWLFTVMLASEDSKAFYSEESCLYSFT